MSEKIVKPEPKISAPLVLQIENTSDEEQSFVLFGTNEFLMNKNYGNSKDVKVTTLNNPSNYASVLINLISTNVRIDTLRVQSINNLNLRKKLLIIENYQWTHHLGFVKTERELNLAVMLDPYQQQSDILDIRVKIEINKRVHIKGVIEPKSIIVIAFFPTVIETIIDNKTTYILPKREISEILIITKFNQKIKTAFTKFKQFFKTKSKK